MQRESPMAISSTVTSFFQSRDVKATEKALWYLQAQEIQQQRWKTRAGDLACMNDPDGRTRLISTQRRPANRPAARIQGWTVVRWLVHMGGKLVRVRGIVTRAAGGKSVLCAFPNHEPYRILLSSRRVHGLDQDPPPHKWNTPS
jgi:hypothetical protein